MLSKISVAALTVMALASPAMAQTAWAPWAIEPTPAPQVRTAPVVQRVVAQAAPQVQNVAPAVRMFRFERFWVVGSFR